MILVDKESALDSSMLLLLVFIGNKWKRKCVSKNNRHESMDELYESVGE